MNLDAFRDNSEEILKLDAIETEKGERETTVDEFLKGKENRNGYVKGF